MKKLVGYLDGTNPLWLTSIQLLGRDTRPLSNGQDGHGLNMQLITQDNKPDIVLCWLHKLIWPASDSLSPRELLHNTTLYEIPVLVACPREHHDKVPGIFGAIPENVRLIDPDEILDAAIAATE